MEKGRWLIMNKIMWTVIILGALYLCTDILTGNSNLALTLLVGFVMLIAIGYIVNLKK